MPDNYIGSLEYLCNMELIQSGYRTKFDRDEQYDIFYKFNESEENIKEWSRQYDLILNNKNKLKEIARSSIINNCFY